MLTSTIATLEQALRIWFTTAKIKQYVLQPNQPIVSKLFCVRLSNKRSYKQF